MGQFFYFGINGLLSAVSCSFDLFLKTNPSLVITKQVMQPCSNMSVEIGAVTIQKMLYLLS